MRDSIFVSAGEVSGDHYVAQVYERLRAQGFDGRVYGLCGDEARRAGVEGLWRAERLQLIGVAEVLGSLGDILRLKREMHDDIMARAPKAIVFVDSPDFHLPLMRVLRRSGYGGKIFYISPPSVWAWRSYRVRDLARHVDECLPLFKFEHDYLTQRGIASYWIGHPMLEEFADRHADRRSILAKISGDFDRASDAPIVALFPGSRRGEIEQLYPILSELYDALRSRGYRPVFSVAPGLSEHASDILTGRIEAVGQCSYRGAGRDLMAVSDLVAGSSGTATIEALLLQKYMVVLYKVRPLSALIGKLLLSHLFFALPNLLAGEMFYPELIQENATAENARREAFAWLEALPEARAAKEARMRGLLEKMGRRGAYDYWTERILKAVSFSE